eukprot:1146054-Amphidinium_carterae.1
MSITLWNSAEATLNLVCSWLATVSHFKYPAHVEITSAAVRCQLHDGSTGGGEGSVLHDDLIP